MENEKKKYALTNKKSILTKQEDKNLLVNLY